MDTNTSSQPRDFSKPFHLGDSWDGRSWAIYSNDRFVTQAFGGFLLYRGTEESCRRMYDQWVREPDTFDAHVFLNRR